jgi:hypothetical protein
MTIMTFTGRTAGRTWTCAGAAPAGADSVRALLALNVLKMKAFRV